MEAVMFFTKSGDEFADVKTDSQTRKKKTPIEQLEKRLSLLAH